MKSDDVAASSSRLYRVVGSDDGRLLAVSRENDILTRELAKQRARSEDLARELEVVRRDLKTSRSRILDLEEAIKSHSLYEVASLRARVAQLEEAASKREVELRTLRARMSSKAAVAAADGLDHLRNVGGCTVSQRVNQIDATLAFLVQAILVNLADEWTRVLDEKAADALTSVDRLIASQPIPQPTSASDAIIL